MSRVKFKFRISVNYAYLPKSERKIAKNGAWSVSLY